MKLYHLRRKVPNEEPNTIIDYLYIPESQTLKSYIQSPDCKLIVDYSTTYFLKRVQAVIEGKEDEVPWELLNELEIDKKTASKIAKTKDGFNKYLDSAGTTENLIRIFSERARKTLFELLSFRI